MRYRPGGAGLFFRFALGIAVLVLILIAYMYAVARADPVVRKATIAFDLPTGKPIRILLVSDIHVAGPDMPPSRLERLVRLMNRQRPDIIVLAGDFVSDKAVATRRYAASDAAAPLAALRAPLGVVGVMGNHDHWREDAGFEAALKAAGVSVFANRAEQRGPLLLVGIDDPHTRRDNVAQAFAGLAVKATAVVFSHSPDVIPALPPAAQLILVGHTHCGQISLPIIGPLTYASRTGARYGCGHSIEGDRHIFVGAGLGTSILPLRLGAVPDMWLITLVPTKDRQ